MRNISIKHKISSHNKFEGTFIFYFVFGPQVLGVETRKVILEVTDLIHLDVPKIFVLVPLSHKQFLYFLVALLHFVHSLHI